MKKSVVPSEHLLEPVSGHVRTDLATLAPDLTVEQALQSIRSRTLAERIVYFYVVDSVGRLLGVVPTRRLLMAPSASRVDDIMVRRLVTLPGTATLLEACEAFLAHKYLALPVVDLEGRLLGVVDVSLFTDEIADLSERKAAEDVFQLIGIHAAEGRPRSPWAGFRDRFPWLLANIAGGTVCALLAGLYESLLDAAIVLALFIPVVLALAESVSMQSVTLTLQSLHASRVRRRLLTRALAREFAVALLLGVVCGALVGSVAWAWKGNLAVALAILPSIALSMLTACLLGVLLPTALRALRRDPRVAAGPIVLALGDVLTLLFYFNLAGWVL